MNILKVFNKKEITYFNYMISLNNLKSILIYDTIRPRNFLESREIEFHDISIEEYQKNRHDNFHLFFPDEDIHDYVPLYISSHTSLIKKYANPNYYYYAVLKVSNTILNNLKQKRTEIKFSNQNINQITLKNLQIKNITEFSTMSELNNFFRWDLFNDNNLPETHEEKLYKSAEILIPKKVHRKFIIKIYPKTNQKRKIKDFLKYSLGDNWYGKIEHLIGFYNQEFEFI